MIDKYDIKNRLSLPEVVSYCLGEPIQRGGFVPCIFHKDNTPSCKIYNDHYYCYSCKRYGDVIQWVLEWEKAAGENIDFKQALKICNDLLQDR